MEQIEIILRTTTPSGKVTEQLLAKFDTEKPVIESDKVLQYSGLHIDPDKHQVSYQGSVLPLTETYEFQTFVYLSSQPGRVYTKEQIYQAVWSRIQICRCPRGMSPWDVSFLCLHMILRSALKYCCLKILIADR